MAGSGIATPLITAREAGLVACQQCGRVHKLANTVCNRCGGGLQSRDETSIQRVWAWLIAGIIAYVPANIYPILITDTLKESSQSTIIKGVFELSYNGNFGIAAIVFTASVIIPIGKFLAIIYLAITVQRTSALNQHQRHHLFEIVEFIGRWSMVDIFVVAILSSLVQLDTLATINPGLAAFCFALSVVFTMISAQSFDARLIWDADRKPLQ